MPQPQTKPPSAPDLAELLRRAAAHHKRGELHEAETLYRDIIAVEPNHFDALHLCGVLMHQRGRPVDALALMARALRANDRAAPAHSNHGIVLAALKRYDEALASYQRALTLKPGYAEAFYNRGNALAALGRNDEALASFEQAVALRGDYRDALINRAQLLHRLGRSSEALPGLARAIALKSDAAVLALRGNIHYAMGSYAAALADYERVIELRPQAAEMHNNRGNALRELGRHHDALESFVRALARKPDYARSLQQSRQRLRRTQSSGRGACRLRARAGTEEGFRRRAGQSRQCAALSRPHQRSARKLRCGHRAQPETRRSALEQGAHVFVARRFRQRLARL